MASRQSQPATTTRRTVSATAFHEAGHAVIAVLAFRHKIRPLVVPTPVTLIEIAVEGTTLRGEGRQYGRIDHSMRHTAWAMLEWDLVMHFSGGIAEAIYHGARGPRGALRFALSDRGMGDDLISVQRLIGALNALRPPVTYLLEQDLHRYYAGLAWETLKANWTAVEAVAQALMEKRTLAGDEVEALIDAAGKVRA